jgi:tryptophan synthase alpha chain
MRLSEHTASLRASGRKALVPFLTAGYPDDDAFGALVRSADAAGADVIEIGVPFSDPIADGPVIQHASNQSLAHGMTLRRALDAAARLGREVRAPLVIMSYVNPILRMGADTFAREAARAGVAGVILPDVSFEESAPFRAVAREAGLAYVDLVAPTSGDERVREIVRGADGFVYVVSLTGTTGAREAIATGLPALLERVRAQTRVPAYVGFGISSAQQAAEVARQADGVIIGSRLTRLAADGPAAGAGTRVGEFLAAVRRTLDAA